MAINHDHLHSTTDKAVSLEEDYRKISEMYIEATNKNGALELENAELTKMNANLSNRLIKAEAVIRLLQETPHTDNTAVIDELQKRIKELEHKLYGNSGQSTRLLNRINNFHSTDPKATDLIEDCYKRIHQQMQVISKLETTVSNLENVQELENSQKKNG